jgi:hypothetical protein
MPTLADVRNDGHDVRFATPDGRPACADEMMLSGWTRSMPGLRLVPASRSSGHSLRECSFRHPAFTVALLAADPRAGAYATVVPNCDC